MAEEKKYRKIRGTRDILPDEALRWQVMESEARKVLGIYSYGEMRTPVIEETGLFIKSVGEDTDIVKKEMFSFIDRGERDISLRPEGTAPIVRAYIENNLSKTDPFQKLYYIGPMFRAERPQAGRLRQFHQLGVEAVGSSSPALDAEVIEVMARIIEASGLKDFTLKLNNLGCRDDKKRLSAALKEAFSHADVCGSLCDDCKRRTLANPLRVLDCKNETCRRVVRSHFKDIKFICAECESHFNEVLKYLKLSGIGFSIDPFIVRGLDYYTRTVFEVSCDALGAQNAVGAGGRYDNLVSDMGGEAAGACGFAIGLDRVMLALGPVAETAARHDAAKIFIAAIGPAAYEKAYAVMGALRKAGVSCDIDYEGRSLKSQMRSADRLGAGFVLIVGDDELKRGEALLRDMRTKEQSSVPFDSMVECIKKKTGLTC